jgi:hypothetical protein
MTKDRTIEERFETVLHHFGVVNSGVIAAQLHDEYIDWVENYFPQEAMDILDRSDDAK